MRPNRVGRVLALPPPDREPSRFAALGKRQKWPRFRTVSNGARAADGNRPQSGREYQGAPGPRSPLRKSLDDAVLPSYSSTILPMNTKIFFPIWFLSLPVMAAGSSPPKFRAVEIDTKINGAEFWRGRPRGHY